jgi:hypothetical protein
MIVTTIPERPRVEHVTRLALPIEFVGANGRRLLEVLETEAGAVMRFFDKGGDLALVLGQENDEAPRVSIVRGEVPVVEMSAIDDGGFVCARSQDFSGPFVEMTATALGPLVNAGTENAFRDLAAA